MKLFYTLLIALLPTFALSADSITYSFNGFVGNSGIEAKVFCNNARSAFYNNYISETAIHTETTVKSVNDNLGFKEYHYGCKIKVTSYSNHKKLDYISESIIIDAEQEEALLECQNKASQVELAQQDEVLLINYKISEFGNGHQCFIKGVVLNVLK